jgi:CRP-like cAMP-binding protein
MSESAPAKRPPWFGEQATSYPAGASIFHEGVPGECMYGILEGEVSLRVRDTEVETAGPGDFFGELALIDRGPRSAASVAKTDCQIVPIDERRFQFMVQQTPFFAIEVMRKIAARLRAMNAKV